MGIWHARCAEVLQQSINQEQIDQHLSSLGLNQEAYYYYGNEYVSLTDVNATSDNVVISADGTLLFIDPIINIKTDVDTAIQGVLELS